MKKLILILFLFLNASVCFSQSILWKKTKLKPSESPSYVKNLHKDKYQIFSLNYDTLKSMLVDAPLRTDPTSRFSVVVSFPDDRGNMERFNVFETSILAPAIAVKHPSIKTYIGFSLDNPGARIRFSVTPQGLKTMTSYLNKPTLVYSSLRKRKRNRVHHISQGGKNNYKKRF